MATTTVSARPFTARVNRIEPSGTLVMLQEAGKLRATGAHLIDLGAGEPHFTTPAHVKDAGILAIEQNFTKYTAAAGIAELRAAIAERHATDWGSNYRPEEAMTTPGGKFALFLAFQCLVEEGDEVIVPVPYWVSFKDIVRFAGAKCVYVETSEAEDFQLSAAQVERAITPRTRAIILNSPCNPSGSVLSAEDYEHIVMLAHERGIYVICDECYVYLNYAEEGDRISAGRFTEAKEHLVMVGSLSKTYAMTGWRSGFALAPKPVIEQMAKLQSQSTSSISGITQKAAVAALTGPQDSIASMRADYLLLREECLAGLERIPQLTCVRPRGAFYTYPNVSAYVGKKGIGSVSDISDRLLHEAHVVTNPGESFGTAEHIRLSYAVSHDDLAVGLKRMKAWFEEQL